MGKSSSSGLVGTGFTSLCLMGKSSSSGLGVTRIMPQYQNGKWETLFTCPYTFKFRTRPFMGTASGMASDSVRGRYQNEPRKGF